MLNVLHLAFQSANLGGDILDKLEIDVGRRCGSNLSSDLRLLGCYMRQAAKADNFAGRGVDSLDQV